MLAALSWPMTAALAQSSASTVARNILFIGDSFTFWQNGIYAHFEKLAAAAKPRWWFAPTSP